MSSTIPKIYVPKKGMTLDDVPTAENEAVQGNVRTSLLLVEGDSSNRKVSLKADYRAYTPDMHYIDVTAEDIIWKWQDMQAKGSGYDGVYKTVLGDRTVYHFWDNVVNNQCNATNHATVDFPIPLTESEALWLAGASGLNLTEEACRTGMFDLTHDYYRFNFNPVQIETYLDRMELYYGLASDGIPEERYEEMVEALESLKPPSHFWEGTGVFIAGGTGTAAIVGVGMHVFNRLGGPKGPPTSGTGSGGGDGEVSRLAPVPDAPASASEPAAMSAADAAVVGGAVAAVSLGARLAVLWAGAVEVGGGLLQGVGACMPMFMIMPPSMYMEQNQPPRPMT